jgi:hypothetical protein
MHSKIALFLAFLVAVEGLPATKVAERDSTVTSATDFTAESSIVGTWSTYKGKTQKVGQNCKPKKNFIFMYVRHELHCILLELSLCIV